MRFIIVLTFSLIGFVCFSQIEETELNPCQQNFNHPKIHFLKDTDDFHEIECDSIAHLFSLINSDDTTRFALLGIYSINTPEERSNGKHRAQLLKSRLVELGIDGERLIIHPAYHKEPEYGKARDWPFYPESFKYEIGVYLQVAFD